MHVVPVIALIDGEHHPSAVRDVLAGLDLAGLVFCGGEEKLGPGSLEEHYGMPVETEVEEGLRRLAPGADAVVDLADEPVVPASRKLRLAALALSLGLAYEAPGASPRPAALRADRLRRAEAGGDRDRQAHREDRGGRPLGEPPARPGGGPRDRVHGTRRPGGAEPDGDGAVARRSDRDRGERLARGVRLSRGRGDRGRADGRLPSRGRRLRGRAVRVERAGRRGARGVARAGRDRVRGLWRVHPAGRGGPHRLHPRGGRAGAVRGVPAGARRPRPRGARAHPIRPRARCRSRCDPSRSRTCRRTRAWRCSPRARRQVHGIPEPVAVSTNLARRAALSADLDRAAADGADVYLTELKAAAIDTVARRARAEDARVVFIRNRPIGIDDALVNLYRDARLRPSSSTRATACPIRRG